MSFDSPHYLIAKQLETAIAGWATANWPDAEVTLGYLIEQFNRIVDPDDGESDVVIGILPTSVVDDGEGQAVGMDQDLVTVSVLVMQRMADLETETVRSVDAICNRLRRYLKRFEPAEIVINEDGDTEEPDRRSVNYLAVFDHDDLRSEIFASCISCEYAVCTGELS